MTLQKYKYKGWGICLAYALKNVLSEPGYAYKRYAYKKQVMASHSVPETLIRI